MAEHGTLTVHVDTPELDAKLNDVKRTLDRLDTATRQFHRAAGDLASAIGVTVALCIIAVIFGVAAVLVVGTVYFTGHYVVTACLDHARKRRQRDRA